LSFKSFEFSAELEEALDFMGFKEPTPIQKDAIPIILSNKDLIACAQTGTGKTGAFLLPVLNKIAQQKEESKGINTLIIAPTRELALQIDQQIEAFAYFLGISSLPVYGGGDGSTWDQQKKALKEGADIIVATPGRLIAHLKLGYVNMDHLQHLILDEADRMLDMGFLDDIMMIANKLPKKRQTLLFSATMPDNIRLLSKKLLTEPESINIAISKPAEGVLQVAYMAYDHQKIGLIKHLLNGKANYPSVLIFTSTKKMVREISISLKNAGFQAGGISSDLEQKAREQALNEFRNRNWQILVATDILARGIDIKEISLVINYDVPQDAEDYVHRIGRTARADATGVAITFISDQNQRRFHNIETLIETEVTKIQAPPELGESPKYEPQKRSRGGGGYRGRGNSRRGRGGGYNRNKGRRSSSKGRGKNYSKSNRSRD